MLRIALAATAVLLLEACATGPQTPETDALMPIADEAYGIVIGRMCSDHSLGPGISVLNRQTNEEFSYFGAVNFALRLPAGEYSLFNIGAPGGAVASRDPFVFEVKAASVRYIGTFLYPWGGRECQRPVAALRTKPYQRVYRGFSGRSLDVKLQGPEYYVRLVNEPELPEREFRERFARHAHVPVESALAR